MPKSVSSVAILYRTAAVSKLIEKALIKHGISYRVTGGYALASVWILHGYCRSVEKVFALLPAELACLITRKSKISCRTCRCVCF